MSLIIVSCFILLLLPPIHGAASVNLYVSNFGGGYVSKYDSNGQLLSTFANTSGSPQGIAIGSNGDVFVSSASNNVIQKYSIDQTFFGNFASGNGLNGPQGVAIGPDQNLYVSNLNTNQVLRFNGTTGKFIDIFAFNLSDPRGLVFGADNNLYVSNGVTNTVTRYDSKGYYIDVFASSSQLQAPQGLVFGPDGHLYVAGAVSLNVVRFDGKTGQFIDVFATGNGLLRPIGLAFGGSANSLYVGDGGANAVLLFNGTSGASLGVFTSQGTNGPTYIAFFSPTGAPGSNSHRLLWSPTLYLITFAITCVLSKFVA